MNNLPAPSGSTKISMLEIWGFGSQYWHHMNLLICPSLNMLLISKHQVSTVRSIMFNHVSMHRSEQTLIYNNTDLNESAMDCFQDSHLVQHNLHHIKAATKSKWINEWMNETIFLYSKSLLHAEGIQEPSHEGNIEFTNSPWTVWGTHQRAALAQQTALSSVSLNLYPDLLMTPAEIWRVKKETQTNKQKWTQIKKNMLNTEQNMPGVWL